MQFLCYIVFNILLVSFTFANNSSLVTSYNIFSPFMSISIFQKHLISVSIKLSMSLLHRQLLTKLNIYQFVSSTPDLICL